MAPSPVSDVSMWMMKGKEKLRFLRTGKLVRACLRESNAHSVSLVHHSWSGWPFLVRSEREKGREEKLGMYLL